MSNSNPFGYREYVFYKYAGAVGVFDKNDNLLMYAERKGMNKLGKPIHVYTSRHRTEELLVISSSSKFKELTYIVGDQDLPLSVTPLDLEFCVVDSIKDEEVGSVAQKSRNRITKDEWLLIKDGKEVGKLKSVRYILHSIFFPRKYEIFTQDRIVGTFEQHRNILNFKYTMEIVDQCIDTRLLVSAGIVITFLKTTF